MSSNVNKINDYKTSQKRTIMLTDKSVYNLKGKSVKRKIDLKRIKSIIIGKYGGEFVFHIDGEYDYRFESEKREKLLYHIIKAIV